MVSRDIGEPRGPIEDGERWGAIGLGSAIVAMTSYEQRSEEKYRGP